MNHHHPTLSCIGSPGKPPGGGFKSVSSRACGKVPFSVSYAAKPKINCLTLELQRTVLACFREYRKEGNRMVRRSVIMATTTSNSISVDPKRLIIANVTATSAKSQRESRHLLFPPPFQSPADEQLPSILSFSNQPYAMTVADVQRKRQVEISPTCLGSYPRGLAMHMPAYSNTSIRLLCYTGRGTEDCLCRDSPHI